MSTETARSYEFGPFRLDPATGTLLRDGHPVPLPPKAFDALLHLVRSQGRIAPKEDLMKALWPDTFVTESNLTQTIFVLRKALGDTGAEQRYIVTAPGRGYRFAAAVIELSPAAGPSSAPQVPAAPTGSRHLWPAPLVVGVGLIAVGAGYLPWAPSNSGERPSPPATSMPMPLTSFPGIETEAAWSPDGRQLAFVWNGEEQVAYDVYLMQPGSSQTLRLTTGRGTNGSPAWSPDGHWIAYTHVSEDRRRYSLNLISPLGGTPRTLLTRSAPVAAPAWAPDGRSLVVEATSERGGAAELWAVSVDTGSHRRLTSPPPGIPGDIGPAVSPDGRTLAFCRKTGWRTAEIFLLGLTPEMTPLGVPRQATNLGYVGRPAWAPDGARLLFEAPREGTGIWQMDVSDRRIRPVFGVPDTASWPAVARRPGGHTSLVFTNAVSETSIWRYGTGDAPDGAPLELAPSSRSQSYPQYSNDGTRLAFSSTRTGHEEIWIANQDGSGAIQLTGLRRQLTEVGHWSPGDQSIAFVSQDRGSRQIYVVSPTGGPAVRLTSEQGVLRGGGWSADGRAYYYTSSRSGRLEVWKVSRHGGTPEQMTTAGGEQGFESRRGIFYYWRPNGRGRVTLVRRLPDGDREVPLTHEVASPPVTAPAPDGFYYKPADSQDVYLFDEGTGQSRRVLADLTRPFSHFTISPDGRRFAADFLARSHVDLMLMEHFD